MFIISSTSLVLACTQFDNDIAKFMGTSYARALIQISLRATLWKHRESALMHVSWSVYSFANLLLDNIFILWKQKLQLQVY